ncbi:tyrosine-type recombinase/integrase [Ralstonia pseudosolanacearum]|uniref:tyrosine-type recombinase/integrase n=3 Tax=Ralstonia pseudosolanacearum TaxID=1310165 RepID=UPI003CF2CAB4
MASIRQRGNKWQARIARMGFPPEVKTFGTRQDAERWARSIETEMDRGSYVSRSGAESATLGDVLERYIVDVCPSMRGGAEDTIRLRAMSRTRLAKLSMAALTPMAVAAYRDERLKQVQPGTVIRELAYLSAIINHARREWGINVTNPVASVRKPPTPQGRDRVLTAEEEYQLLAALAPTGRRNPWLRPMTILSLETAMRRGELLSLRWSNIDLENQTAFLPMTKNGTARTVPLSRKAVHLLRELPRCIDGRVFPINAPAHHKA